MAHQTGLTQGLVQVLEQVQHVAVDHQKADEGNGPLSC